MTAGTDRIETAVFQVPGMDCASCAEKITRSLTALSGTTSVDPQVVAGRVEVAYDPDRVGPADIVRAIERAGYQVEEGPASARGGPSDGDPGQAESHGTAGTDSESIWLRPRALKIWAGAVALVLGIVFQYVLASLDVTVLTVLGRALSASDALYLLGAGVAGEQILRNGLGSVRTRSLDIDLLMSLGILGAVSASLVFGEALYLEAAMLAVLFGIAELLETYAMDRARSSLRELMDLSPTTATRIQDGERETVPVEALAVEDRVAVKPGERIPADGTVLEGSSAVDQAPITGESVPVDVSPGEEVFAGSINQDGFLEVRVDAAAEDSTLAQIISLVVAAQREKTDHERFVDRFSGYYTPVVVVLAVGLILVPPLFFGLEWATWFKRGLALLVLACPCALVISTPVSVVSGITSAARNGVLIKGGRHLEAMGAVDVLAFDKTGTLTRGELAVTDVIPVRGESKADVLQIASTLESRSEHPIAAAIVEAAEEAGITSGTATEFEATAGKGVRGRIEGTEYLVGKPALFADRGIDLDHVHAISDGGSTLDSRPCDHGQYYDLEAGAIDSLRESGKTVVLVGTEDGIDGVIAVADEVRPESQAMVARLRELGIQHVVMLTGDHEATARAVSEEIGVDEVHAELLPGEKAEVIDDLESRYEGVAMVGDGINDAPALASATVGIAMGAAGTDTAIETADVALMADDLAALPYLVSLSQRSNSVIRQNIVASIGIKALLALGVPFGLVNVAVAVIVGDMGMSLGVTGNALRLAGVRAEEPEN